MRVIPLLKMIMANSMYNKCKILFISSLFCILSVCAGKGIHNIYGTGNTFFHCSDIEFNALSGQSTDEAYASVVQYDVISDFSDYITNLFHNSSFKLPSSVNFLTERAASQYLRVRKTFENSSFGFRQKSYIRVAANQFCSDEVYTGRRFAYSCEYFIYTLNRLRI